MITDSDTNMVFVADTLVGRFPELYAGLKTILTERGIPLRTIQGTRDVWCRDYMPIQIAEDRLVQFRYAPDYLTGKYRHLRADGEIGPSLPFVRNCERSEIVLDGGNVVGRGDKVILTEKIFVANSGWQRQRLLAKLGDILEVGQLVLIPPEPGDVTGHADGVVRFVDGGTVVLNGYRGLDPGYRRVLRRRLEQVGLEIAEVPYRPGSGSAQGMPSAIGNYVNFLLIEELVIVPSYGRREDDEARETLSRVFPGFDVHAVECRRIGREGGCLNCVTWTVKTSE
jgi:agmatine/peptidylarginine deiminase